MKNGINSVKIKELFKNLPVEIIGKNIEVQGISSHSKTVKFQDLFIAKHGFKHNGADYLSEAVLSGASAILTDLYHPLLKGVTQVIASNPKELEGYLADKLYQSPSKKLLMVGITGTNGKTSSSYLIRQLLGEGDCGLIGTIEYIFGKDRSIDATLTTPDVISNHKMLASMVRHRMKSAVMEVTSIALTQNRIDHIDFDIALFTNFSQDHLDYHKTMEEYLSAKAKLFDALKIGATAIVNMDDLVHHELTRNCRAYIKTFGQNAKADYCIQNIVLKPNESTFTLKVKNQSYPITVPLIGLFNVYNVVGAISVALEAKVSINTILEKASKLVPPRGRLQSIRNSIGAYIFVDFAHTEDALIKVMTILKQIGQKRLITLFGCGGDRDPIKRPLMGRAASSMSDITIITSDNPRSEDPAKICQQVLAGCDKEKEVHIILDRKTALAKALEMLESEDILLVAGRGHEKNQLIGNMMIPFEDGQVVEELLKTNPVFIQN